MRNQFKAWTQYMNGGALMAKKTKPNARSAARKRASARRAGAEDERRRDVTARMAPDTLREVEQFLYRQAECLDGKRWQDFIDLFAEDGIYWMPAAPEQTTGDGVPSIFCEDRNLMTVRMKRVTHPHAWSQTPMWGTNHVVGNVAIEKEDASTGELVVRSRFHMMEFRHDTTRHFAGTYLHHLKKTKARLSHQAPARRHGERAGAVRLRAAGVGVSSQRERTRPRGEEFEWVEPRGGRHEETDIGAAAVGGGSFAGPRRPTRSRSGFSAHCRGPAGRSASTCATPSCWR